MNKKKLEGQYFIQFQNNINNLLKITKQKNLHVLLAVSGGSDSMCMLDFASTWSELTKIKISVAFVNHNLRNVDKEIALIKKYCHNKALQFYTLNWNHSGIKSNIQAQAREARYSLLTNLCKKILCSVLMTAHNSDDIVEKILINLSRGTGISGLKTNKISLIKNIIVVRPLYNFTKLECVEILKKEGIKWIEDPSNHGTRFLRSKIRHFLSEYKKIDPNFNQSVFQSSLNIDQDYSVFRQSILDTYSKVVKTSFLGYACIDIELLSETNITIQNIILYYIIAIIRGSNRMPRMKKIVKMRTALVQYNQLYYTLHGCKLCVNKKKNIIVIYRLFDTRDYNSKNNLCIYNQKIQNEVDSTLWDCRYKCSIINTANNVSDEKQIIKITSRNFSDVLCNKESTQLEETEEDIINKIKNADIISNKSIFTLNKNDIRCFLSSLPFVHKHSFSVSNNKIIFLHKAQKICCEFIPNQMPQIFFDPN